jgi:hypothetical protein
LFLIRDVERGGDGVDDDDDDDDDNGVGVDGDKLLGDFSSDGFLLRGEVVTNGKQRRETDFGGLGVTQPPLTLPLLLGDVDGGTARPTTS